MATKKNNRQAMEVAAIGLTGFLAIVGAVVIYAAFCNRKIEILRKERNICFAEMQGSILVGDLIGKIYQIDELSTKIADYDTRAGMGWTATGDTMDVTQHWSFRLKESEYQALSPEKRKAIEQILLAGEYGYRGAVPFKPGKVNWNDGENAIEIEVSWIVDFRDPQARSDNTHIDLKGLLK